jgi:hypothetical protein
VHPNAVRVMRSSTSVISLCDRVREVCPQFPGHPGTIHSSIANPAAGDADDDASCPAFQQTAAELETRIGFLLAVLTDRPTAPRHQGES